jgi:hypothetical protein
MSADRSGVGGFQFCSIVGQAASLCAKCRQEITRSQATPLGWTAIRRLYLGMPRKPPRPRKDSDPEQLRRFKNMAREAEADESLEAFDRAFTKVVHPQKRKLMSPKKPV